MKRHESRKISRNRLAVQKLNPCSPKFSNPFAYLFQKMIAGVNLSPQEKEIKRELKMQADQKSAKARQNRKRNKV